MRAAQVLLASGVLRGKCASDGVHGRAVEGFDREADAVFAKEEGELADGRPFAGLDGVEFVA
jgi:hypothetical protein